MELVILVICVAVSWAIAHLVDSLPDLGRLLLPSPWMLGILALIVITWIMRD